jgi:hypothetical protein
MLKSPMKVTAGTTLELAITNAASTRIHLPPLPAFDLEMEVVTFDHANEEIEAPGIDTSFPVGTPVLFTEAGGGSLPAALTPGIPYWVASAASGAITLENKDAAAVTFADAGTPAGCFIRKLIRPKYVAIVPDSETGLAAVAFGGASVSAATTNCLAIWRENCPHIFDVSGYTHLAGRDAIAASQSLWVTPLENY